VVRGALTGRTALQDFETALKRVSIGNLVKHPACLERLAKTTLRRMLREERQLSKMIHRQLDHSTPQKRGSASQWAKFCINGIKHDTPDSGYR
jgi:hypothetical protein